MSTKKKVLLIAGGSLLALLTIVNVNMGRKNTSFIGTILSNVEAYASSSEGESGKFHCGRAAYTWKKLQPNDTDVDNFVQCVKGCPDKQGKNPLFKDCQFLNWNPV